MMINMPTIIILFHSRNLFICSHYKPQMMWDFFNNIRSVYFCSIAVSCQLPCERSFTNSIRKPYVVGRKQSKSNVKKIWTLSQLNASSYYLFFSSFPSLSHLKDVHAYHLNTNTQTNVWYTRNLQLNKSVNLSSKTKRIASHWHAHLSMCIVHVCVL